MHELKVENIYIFRVDEGKRVQLTLHSLTVIRIFNCSFFHHNVSRLSLVVTIWRSHGKLATPGSLGGSPSRLGLLPVCRFVLNLTLKTFVDKSFFLFMKKTWTSPTGINSVTLYFKSDSSVTKRCDQKNTVKRGNVFCKYLFTAAGGWLGLHSR